MLVYSADYVDSLPNFDRSVSLVAWAYNEEKLIENFVRSADALLKSCVDDYEIVIVDDGSRDGTPVILSRLSEEISNLMVLTNEVNRNVGFSARRALTAATKDYVFWQTVDWSYDIKMLRVFLELLKRHDVVAGVRRAPVQVRSGLLKPAALLIKLFGVEHVTRRSDTLGKAFVSLINYMLVRVLFGLNLSDYQNVSIYPTKIIKSLIDSVESSSSFMNPELLYKANMLGASIVEVPVNFIPRKVGSAKGTRLKAIISSVRDIVICWWRWRVLGAVHNTTRGRITRLKPEEWGV